MNPTPWNVETCYAILDAVGNLICEQSAQTAHQALLMAKESRVYGVKGPRVAMPKAEYERMENLQDKWMKAGRRVEG